MNERLEIRAAPGKGRRMFAIGPIAADALLDRALTIELGARDTAALPGCTLDDYHFYHREDPAGGLFVLGTPALVNHAPEPNATVVMTRDPALGWVVELRARRAIAAGEEITIDYDCPLWFDPKP